MKIAYLGPAGTFTEDALREAAAGESFEPLRAATVHDAIVAVERGEADRALVPFENSIEGSVRSTLDTLAFETGEVWSIDTSLLAADTVRLFTGEIERLFASRLEAYARFLAGLGLMPPYRWIAGLAGVKGRRLQIPQPQGQMQIALGPECLSETVVEQGLYDGKQTPSSALLPFFKAIFDKCGIPRPNYLST